MSDGDKSSTETRGIGRRTTLKAMGAGALLPFGSGAVEGRIAQPLDSTSGNSVHQAKGTGAGKRCDPCIDTLTGWASLAISDTGGFTPDHTVKLELKPTHVLFAKVGDVPPSSAEQTEPGSSDVGSQEFPDFFYDPVGLSVAPGDIVEFPNPSEDLHTVTAYSGRFQEQRRIPKNATPFSSPPIAPSENWLYQFHTPGVYDLYCFPHEFLGMAMRVVVSEEGGNVPQATEFASPDESSPGGPSPNAVKVLSAPELDPQNIVDQGMVAWTDLTIKEKVDPATVFGPPGGEGGGGGGSGESGNNGGTQQGGNGKAKAGDNS